ncbi:MAG: diguanylate cyclase [Epsilonproteobacteria bacterium]|nr:MAG: diguanylate cyclase [Campylobacterota bacterium]
MRFVSVSVVVIIIAYFYEKTIQNTIEKLIIYMDKVEYLNKNLEFKIEEALDKNNILNERYKQQAQILEQVNDSVVSIDFNGNIVSWNTGSEKMLGYSSDEVIGKKISIIYRKEDMKTNEEYAKRLLTTGSFNVNLYLVKKSKDLVYVSLSLSLLQDENGNIIGYIGVSHDITQRKKDEEKLLEQKNILEYQAHHDALTGLPNRVLFNDRLNQAIQKAKRNNTKVALLFIDLDHFKEINDSLGHETGDEILKIVTLRLTKTIRDEDSLARLGGDEFTVIIENLVDGQDASLLAQKITEVLSQPITLNTNIFYVSSSTGISIYPDDGESTQNLLKFADAAMYKAKDEGRNNYQYYDSIMTELAFERVVMVTSLREALKKSEFLVYYQPQVDGKSNKLIGMEALVRWQHPTMGIVSPAKFIPLAESTGLIIELDRFVMKTAMTQVSKWNSKGLKPGILAMNLAIKQLQQKDFIDMFKNLIKETGCTAEHIELEVTEGQIMTNPEEAIKILNKISNIGIGLAVDDFGTGYSSLSYLKKLPIDKLKIDQSFIKDIPDDEEDMAITKAVIALAKSLNLKIIAEGVETIQQRDFVVQNGCTNIQGYFYSKPIPANEIEKLLLEGFQIK